MNSGHLITNSASISKQILLSAVRTQYAKRGQLIASIGDPGSTKASLITQKFCFLVINNNYAQLYWMTVLLHLVRLSDLHVCHVLRKVERKRWEGNWEEDPDWKRASVVVKWSSIVDWTFASSSVHDECLPSDRRSLPSPRYLRPPGKDLEEQVVCRLDGHRTASEYLGSINNY